MARRGSKQAAAASQEPDPDEPSGIRTIGVAVRILTALADYTEPVRVTDIARRLGMTMPTISRHLATWRKLGFVDKPEGQETYRLSMRLLSLSNAAIRQNDYAGIARPFLSELRNTISETIVFVAKVEDHAVALVCLDSGLPTTVVVREGSSVELPFSPSARLIYAFSDVADDLDATADSFDYSSEPNWNAGTFKRRVRAAREEWYDFEIDLVGTHIGAIAAPVFDHNDSIVGAVSIIRPSRALQPEPPGMLVDRLKQTAAQISAALGSHKWDGHVR